MTDIMGVDRLTDDRQTDDITGVEGQTNNLIFLWYFSGVKNRLLKGKINTIQNSIISLSINSTWD